MNRTVKIRYIPKGISNEYLLNAFQRFGDVQRALVFDNGNGKLTFKDETGARNCIQLLRDHCFFLGSSMAPISVEMEPSDQIGMPEQSFLVFDPAVEQERSREPYFAQTPLELKFQKEWLNHFELEKEAREDMERALAQERTNLKNSQQRRATEELVKKHDELVKSFKKKLEEP